MKITGIRTTLFEIQLSRRIGDANSPAGRDRMASVAVFLDTDEGLEGIALASPAARPHVHALVSDVLVGQDPRGVRAHWKRMVDLVFKGGNIGIVSDALSAIDVALWDLKAKAAGEPLWRMLGASSGRVKAYASGIDMPLSDEELRTFYGRLAARGIAAGKLKVGLDPEADLRRIGIMREALSLSGGTPLLMVDANEYWSPKQAIRRICVFEDHYDLTWVEEPARRWDYRGLRKVSQSIRAAVATGENLDEISQFTPLISSGAVDVVQIGAGTSGVTGALQVADLAYGFDLPVSMMNCPGNFMAHVAAALPNHVMMEVIDAGRDAVMRVDSTIEGGWIVLGDSPGLGISFDLAQLARAAVEVPSRDAGPSPWGRRQGAGLTVVPPAADEIRGNG
jgi:L-alanine-DL-glutamate epimerase-like enolase superfamily enzyme